MLTRLEPLAHAPQIYVFARLFVPAPRLPLRAEKKFITVDHAGNLTEPEQLPSWQDSLALKITKAQKEDDGYEQKEVDVVAELDPAEVFITLVIPAFNEEHRLTGMLEEAVNYLETEYSSTSNKAPTQPNGTLRKRKTTSTSSSQPTGWEILLINDGSTDATLTTCTNFMRSHILPPLSPAACPGPGPTTPTPAYASLPPQSA